VRLDVLLTSVPAPVARGLDRLSDLVGLAVSTIFVVYGGRAIASSALQGSMVIKSIVFPEWWLYAPVPLCFALLAVEFTRRILYGGVLEGSGPHA